MNSVNESYLFITSTVFGLWEEIHTQIWGECAKKKQAERPSIQLGVGPSCCEVTVLLTKPTRCQYFFG